MYVHFAPPCGTASRARLIQNSEQNLPPPLRNDQYPNGVPWLTMGQQIRVDKANNLYSITCRLIRLCEDHQILWSCENPGRSFMWQTTPFQELFSTMQCLSTGLHHCMFGSSRRKLTRLVHNISSFHHLHQLCDNSHGAKSPMDLGQLPRKRLTHGHWHDLSQHKCFSSCKIYVSNATHQALQNKKLRFKQ